MWSNDSDDQKREDMLGNPTSQDVEHESDGIVGLSRIEVDPVVVVPLGKEVVDVTGSVGAFC